MSKLLNILVGLCFVSAPSWGVQLKKLNSEPIGVGLEWVKHEVPINVPFEGILYFAGSMGQVSRGPIFYRVADIDLVFSDGRVRHFPVQFEFTKSWNSGVAVSHGVKSIRFFIKHKLNSRQSRRKVVNLWLEKPDEDWPH